MVNQYSAEKQKALVRLIDRKFPTALSMTTVAKMSRTGSKNATPDLLASSVSGTTFLIVIQLTSRVLTFAANQLVLRSLSPEILGTAAQLELYLVSILYFSRESTRLAIQRQSLGAIPTAALNGEEAHYGKSRTSETRSIALQSVVNISYLSFGIGALLLMPLSAFYFYFASEEVSGKPFFQTSLIITGLASLLELCIEPFFAVVQQRMLYKTRAAVETTAAFLKALLVCSIFSWASWVGYDIGVLPFALSYLGHALALICGYVMTMSIEASKNHFSFLLTPVKYRYVIGASLARVIGSARINNCVFSDESNYVAGKFSRRLMTLSANVFLQAVIKHLLTQGDSLMLAAMSSLEDQGIYALACNYGGLVARIILQPIEESSRNLFSTLLTYNESGQQDTKCVEISKSHIVDILQVYGILSIIALPLFPVLAPLALHILGGRRWSSPKVDSLFSLYCYYVPFLAFNGITEAFVSAAAEPSELRRQASWMGGFSACFCLAAYIFLELCGLGAHGLVLANIVNMSVRTAWSFSFITSYFRHRNSRLAVGDVSLHMSSYLAAFTTSILLADERYIEFNFHGFLIRFAVGTVYVCLM